MQHNSGFVACNKGLPIGSPLLIFLRLLVMILRWPFAMVHQEVGLRLWILPKPFRGKLLFIPLKTALPQNGEFLCIWRIGSSRLKQAVLEQHVAAGNPTLLSYGKRLTDDQYQVL